MAGNSARRLNTEAVEKKLIEENEMFNRRIELLEGPDRAIAAMYFGRGATMRQIAEVAGMNEVTVSRRLRRILCRLANWARVCGVREDGMGRMEERIAREYLVRGRSQRAVAARLGVTRYAVRKVLLAVAGASGCRNRRSRDTVEPRGEKP